MTPTVITPEVLDDLYGWLAGCAMDRDPCPLNQEICDKYGFKSVSTSAYAIGKLEATGRIEVMRGTNVRRVKIVATGSSTAAIKVPPPKMPKLHARPAPKPTQPKPVQAAPRRKPVDISPRPGRKGRQCQWIAGEPTRKDSCKCLAETRPGSSWCEAHHERAYVRGGYIPSVYRVDPKTVAA